MPTNMPYCAPDELPAECWCRSAIVPVPVIEVRRDKGRLRGAPWRSRPLRPAEINNCHVSGESQI